MRVTLYSDGNYRGFENDVEFPLIFNVGEYDIKLLGREYGIDLKMTAIPHYSPDKGAITEGGYLPDSGDGYLYFCPDEYEIF